MFDIHQRLEDDCGQRDEKRYQEYLASVLAAFADSPEGRACSQANGRLGYARIFLDYYFGYIGGALSEISESAVREVVFELFPRKVSAEPESAPEIVTELRAFCAFLGREFRLPQAAAIEALLDEAAILDLKNLLADPSTYGAAKSFVMMGRSAGFDMSSEEGMHQFMAVYNAAVLGARAAGRPGGSGKHASTGSARPFGLSKMNAPQERHVGRNDPCPCGSGKKFKKCCNR